MRTTLKLSIACTMLLLITSCSVLNMGALQIGMTKSEVNQMLGPTYDDVIQARKEPDGSVMEVVQYSGYNTRMGMQKYWLYFKNDKLEKWSLYDPEMYRSHYRYRDGRDSTCIDIYRK